MFKNKVLVAVLALAFSFTANAAKIDQDELILQKPGSSAQKKLKMGNGQLIYDPASGKMKFSNDAGASTKNIGSGGGGASGINLIGDSNPDFESALTGTWTASGGASSQVTSGSNLLFGAGSGLFNASATSQTFSSNAFAIPNGLLSNNGLAYCTFKTAATDYKLQVVQVSTVIAENIIPAISGAEKVYVPFIFPSSGNVFLRVISQSDAADIAMDDCFLGSNDSILIKDAASFYGSIKFAASASCGWPATGPAGYADFAVDANCSLGSSPTGKITAVGTKIPAFQMQVEEGTYYFVASGIFGSTGGADAYFRFSDGTKASADQGINAAAFSAKGQVSGMISYAASEVGLKTINVQSRIIGASTVSFGSANNDVVIEVYRFPLSSSQAQRVNGKASWASVKIVAPVGTTNINNSAASFTTLSHADFAAMTKTYQGGAGACANANDVCMKVAYLEAGVYDVFYRGTLYSGTSDDCGFRLYDGTDAIGAYRTVSQTAQHGTPGFSGQLTVSQPIYDKEIALQAYRESGAGGGCTAYFDTLAKGGTVEIEIIPSRKTVADLLLKQSKQVVNSEAWLDFDFGYGGATWGTTSCTSSPCTLHNSSGGVSSVTRQGTGAYTINVTSGLCSTPLICTESSRDVGAESFMYPSGAASTTTTFQTEHVDTAGAAHDVFAYVHCSCRKP